MTTLASLFNLAGPDLIVIFFIILLLFGAKKLPELAKGLGQAVKEFSRAKDEFEHEITHPAPAQPPQQIEPPKTASTAAAEEPVHEPVHHEETAVPTTKVV
jgi:sec-independent protein translocase protein TatA